MTLGRLLQDRAERNPEKTFLFFEDQEITYASLDEITGRVANGLAGIGVRKGDRVGILLHNCPEFLYAFFGIQKAGAVAVPINFNLKRDEVKYILNDAEICALMTTPVLWEAIGDVRPECPHLSRLILAGGQPGPAGLSFSQLCESEPRGALRSPVDSDPAGIIYTSGTTGYPKGVVLTHRNYLFDTEHFVRAIRMTDQDRFLCILPLFHVNGQVVTTLTPLFAKASMILLEKFSPKDFFPTLARLKATAFSGVPTVYAILLNAPEAEKYDLRSLRFCICGAAPMPVEIFEAFERRFNAYILEGYGLSEGTCVSSVNPLEGQRKIGSIGVPLSGQEMKVVDDETREVRPGQVGEIVVKGENVMRGYFKNPQATAEALREGWLHTGDLGYKDADGYFFIVGRKKEMIIRGGENIYPKEIEEVLYRNPKVLEAAVIGLPDRVWGEEVCAFIVLKEGARAAEEEMIRHCKASLADYKCPRKIVFWDSLPKTATGKVQKGRLRDAYLAGPSQEKKS